MIRPAGLVVAWSFLCGGAPQDAGGGRSELRARYVITVADDFVVDVYLDGKLVPDARRHLLREQFGATAERLDVDVRKGDWLVFNVVNNRLRWNGRRYFAAAGCLSKGEFGFVSSLADSAWSRCDDPSDVGDFIADPIFGAHRPVEKIDAEWQDGTPLMKSFAGASWSGSPVWGASRNTWIKVVVP
jgi:hypothetical protein